MSERTPASDLRRWLDDWRAASVVLDEERWARVKALDDDSSWDAAVSLAALWESAWVGDGGEGLLRQQDVFAKARRPS